jgi:uncharacterized protein (DUF111 family)
VKIGWLDGAAVSARPEYDDCEAAAGKHGAPLKQVYDAVLKGLPNR